MEYQQITQPVKKDQQSKNSSSLQAQPVGSNQPATHPLLRLQRVVGNQAVQQMLQSRKMIMQAKIVHLPAGAGELIKTWLADKEEESRRYGNLTSAEPSTSASDRVATNLPIAAPDSAAEREATALTRSGSSRTPGSQLAWTAPRVGDSYVLDSTGIPVAPQLRHDFEERLGADLSNVRIHDDTVSHEFVQSIGAQAATWGSHIYFAKDRFAPHTVSGREVLHHEFIHTLQPEANVMLHCKPDEDRLQEIQRQLETLVISDDYRMQLERERANILSRRGIPGSPAGLPLSPGSAEPISVVSMSEAEFEAMTGQPASSLPDGPLPIVSPVSGSSQVAPSMLPSAVPGSIGVDTLFTPQPNWYYRVLSPSDPRVADILGGADLLPRPPDPGYIFQPAANPAEMTFRHLRPGGNVPQMGTNRISTAADLEAFQTVLSGRGTGELVRVDVDAARHLGQQFLEQGDIMAHLDAIEQELVQQLTVAQQAGRGRTFISRLEGRLRALRAARDYARTFQEGQGVGRIPARAVTEVRGPNLGEAVAGERAFLGRLRFFRYGGRVLLVVGVGMSFARVAMAPEEQQGRVAAQEAGGWAFSLASASLGAKAGAGTGAALGFETGPGAIVAAAIGSLIGAAIGFFGGEAAANQLYDVGENVTEGLRMLGDTPRLIETTTLMFGSDEDRRNYYEMRQIETGEPPPWDF